MCHVPMEMRIKRGGLTGREEAELSPEQMPDALHFPRLTFPQGQHRGAYFG